MEVTFRLEHVLRKHAPSKLSRGLYASMEEWSAAQSKRNPNHVPLERHKVARLRNNQAKSVSFGMLDSLCSYLVEVCNVPIMDLPQELFGAKEGQLLDLLSSTKKLQFYVGVRSSKEWGPNTYVMASDAGLQSKLTGMISHYLVTRQSAPLETAETNLVKAPPRDVENEMNEWVQIRRSAKKTYGLAEQANDVTLVASGSTKVNCMVEHVLASTFNATPYRVPKSQIPENRKVPIYFRYRDDDPQPPSCCGGLSLSSDMDESENQPGIFYEREDRSWTCVPCNDEHEDVAFVVYVHDLELRQVWLACGGFSSHATRLFTSILDKLVPEFWPPQVKTPKLVVGLFLVRFKLKTSRRTTKVPRQARPLGDLEDYEIIRLEDEVVSRRLLNTEPS